MIENRFVRNGVQVLLVVLVLVGLILTGVRLLLTDVFVRLEYNLPGFPEDTYGMTKAQRLEYAPIALEFLLNGAGPEFLGDLKFEDGTPLFNERELQHMVDVQVLTEAFLRVWVVTLALLSLIVVWAWRGRWMADLRRMLSNAGLGTIVILGTLLVLLLLSFDLVFTNFHRIFFEGDSWLFLYSDTLIRLFPLRFWQDAFVLVGVFTLVGGLALWLGFRKPR
jgi:integral membrane protein (TIGR01906 family)